MLGFGEKNHKENCYNAINFNFYSSQKYVHCANMTLEIRDIFQLNV